MPGGIRRARRDVAQNDTFGCAEINGDNRRHLQAARDNTQAGRSGVRKAGAR
jgi:hypothetical protein